MPDTISQNDMARERLTVTGTRITMGNAVHCPEIRTDDGDTYAVSYLAPTIAIGDRVEIRGFMANVTTCLGPVLYAEDVRHLSK